MAADTEIVAILSSGISFRRMLVPYLLAASILALMSFLLGNFVIPYTNRGKLEFEKIYIKDAKAFNDMNIHKQISPGVFLYMENFNTQTKRGWKFTMEKFRDRELIYKITADEANWDSLRSKWTLIRYFSRSLGPMKESIHKGEKLDTTFGLKPADFMEDIEEVSIMNFFTLRDHIKLKELRGDPDLIKYQVKEYERVAFPFATIVLTLIGVAVSSRKVRGGIGFNLGLGLALTFMYILFMQVFTVMATFGNFPPLLAVWIPNILFGVIALVLVRMAPK
jgi:lipopolysaccharide export system permease protein